MFQVSKDYAPPFKMIEPFFIIGSIFYFLGILILLFLHPKSGHFDFSIVGWAHWFLLGFVMMVIFGAMAQLVPVIVEVGHFAVDLYYVIWPSLLLGVLGMVAGFWFEPWLLPYGGLLVLIAMAVFLFETFLTLKKAQNITLTVKTAYWANIFLLVGILSGFFMTFAIANGFDINLTKWLKAHAMLVLGGYVTLTIIGISMVLLPMFGLAHGFDDKPVDRAFKVMIIGVVLYVLSALIGFDFGAIIAWFIIFYALGNYFYQVYLIYKVRARKTEDIWSKSMFAGFFSLALAFIFGFFNLFIESEQLLLAVAWFVIVGFFGFLITGHLYKIIPFLVWFERFSPLVGKKRVPMLHEMVPVREAEFEFYFSAAGVVIAGFGLMFGSEDIFKGGVLLLVVGAFFLVKSVFWMLRFK